MLSHFIQLHAITFATRTVHKGRCSKLINTQRILYQELLHKVGKHSTKNVKKIYHIQKWKRQAEGGQATAMDKKEMASLKSLIAEHDTKLCVLTHTLRRESIMKNHARQKFDRTAVPAKERSNA